MTSHHDQKLPRMQRFNVPVILFKMIDHGTENMPVLKRLAAYRIYFMKLEREIAMEKGTDQHLQL